MKEEKATDSKLLDSTIILAYFMEGYHKEIIEEKRTLFISTLSLFEVKKKLKEKKVPEEIIEEKIDFIRKRTLSIQVSDDISIRAAKISVENKVPAMDSLIYATALANNSTLLTLDNDFRGLPNVKVLDVK